MQTPGEIAALWTAVFLGGVVSGFCGFAFSAAAGAILLHVFEPMAAVPLMMFCSVTSQTMSLITVHRLIRWGELAPLLTGGTAGAAVSVPFMAAIEARSFRIGFGVCLASYALYMLLRQPTRVKMHAVHSAAHFVIGFVAGVVGGLPAMPGALLVVWCELRGLSKENQRALVQPFIIAIQVIAIGLLLLLSPARSVSICFNVWRWRFRRWDSARSSAPDVRQSERSNFSNSALFIILASGCLMVFSRMP